MSWRLPRTEKVRSLPPLGNVFTAHPCPAGLHLSVAELTHPPDELSSTSQLLSTSVATETSSRKVCSGCAVLPGSSWHTRGCRAVARGAS